MDPWLDSEKLLPGQNWQVEIPKALFSSDVIIVCLSKNSVDKEGYVQKEIKFALDKAREMPEGRIFLIPARLEECDLPYSLRAYQYVNLFEADGYRRLLRSLRMRAEQIGATKISVNQDTTPSDVEKAAREKAEHDGAEKDAREKLERDAAEKLARERAEQENAEKIAREEAERKAVEKAAREKLERDAAEKLARERAEQENAEKIFNEEAERKAADKAARAQAELDAVVKTAREKERRYNAEKIARETAQKKQATQKQPANKPFPAWLGVLGIIFLVIVGVIVATNQHPSTPVSAATATVTALPIATETFSVTASPLPTETITPEPTSTLAPTLDIFLTMASDKNVIAFQVSDKDGMALLVVPPGNFQMGSTDSDTNAQPDEKPQHTVQLDAFLIDQTDVTNKMYALCVSAGACTSPSSTSSATRPSYYGNSEFDNYPVINVNWNMADTYCKWAGRELPTEAQWEKAARGTDGYTYPWGNNTPDITLLNYNGIDGDTTEVGSYPKGASPYGALDMAGNVWQWMNDWYSDTYYQSSPSSNPLGPVSGQDRVLRGGSWGNFYASVRSADRLRSEPTYTNYSVGFRCAMSAAK
jgi:formylglycine-generating enzyme required for sulfatase activity